MICIWVYSSPKVLWVMIKSLPRCTFYFSLLPPCLRSSSSSFSALVVDQSQAVKFALDIASGMAFLHTLEPMVSRLYLNSKHVMVRNCFTVFDHRRISNQNDELDFSLLLPLRQHTTELMLWLARYWTSNKLMWFISRLMRTWQPE